MGRHAIVVARKNSHKRTISLVETTKNWPRMGLPLMRGLIGGTSTVKPRTFSHGVGVGNCLGWTVVHFGFLCFGMPLGINLIG